MTHWVMYKRLTDWTMGHFLIINFICDAQISQLYAVNLNQIVYGFQNLLSFFFEFLSSISRINLIGQKPAYSPTIWFYLLRNQNQYLAFQTMTTTLTNSFFVIFSASFCKFILNSLNYHLIHRIHSTKIFVFFFRSYSVSSVTDVFTKISETVKTFSTNFTKKIILLHNFQNDEKSFLTNKISLVGCHLERKHDLK